MLPDLLAPDLRLVVCAFSAGEKSADDAWFAGGGDRFWETLHTIGLTPRQLEPGEWRSLLDYRIGLVDLEPRDPSGAEGRGARFKGAEDLRKKIRQYAPGMMVFNGKKAAKEYMAMPTVAFGLLPHGIGTTKLFVCPSTHPSAKSSWDPRWWDLATKLA